jgi:hypothetical protein
MNTLNDTFWAGSPLVSGLLVCFLFVFSTSCAWRGIRRENTDTLLVLANMPGHEFAEEGLTMKEQDEVLGLLSYAEFNETPPGSPPSRLKYVLEGVVVRGLGRKVYFMDDGTLLAAKLPDSKAKQLSRLILDIGKRANNRPVD